MSLLNTREKLHSSLGKRKSHRQADDVTKSTNEADDYQRFPFLLQNYCDDRLYPSIPSIHDYLIREDEKPVSIGPSFSIENKNSTNATATIYTYSNMEMNLKTLMLACDSATIIDTRFFFALTQTFHHFPHLTSLNLDYCNLTLDHISILEENLKVRKIITELSLTGNPIRCQNFYRLIRCGLKVLTMKLCEINEKGLKKIAKQFLNYPKSPGSLVHLDLSCNKVFDEGCKQIATIIRCDRTLRSLNLTDCKIRDDGFKLLLSGFSKFLLDKEEIAVRRQIRLEYFKQQQENLSSAGPKDEETINRHPFTSDSFQEAGEIFCKGNYTLENLNLAYNHLTRASLELLLKTLLDQNGVRDRGLQRVILEGNSSNYLQCDNVKATIQELLSKKHVNNSNPSLRTRKSSGDSSVAG